MKTYPTVITAALLERFAHLSDDEVRNDLAVTREEISLETARARALSDVAHTTTNALERRLMDYRATGLRYAIEDRERFVAFLEALLSARGSNLMRLTVTTTQAILRAINGFRQKLGAPPVQSLLRGTRRSACRCPVARTAQVGLEGLRVVVWRDHLDGCAYVGVAVRERSPQFRTNLGETVGAFVKAFDAGAYPDLDQEVMTRG